MDKEQLNAIRARLEAATPGPWVAHDDDDIYCMSTTYITRKNLHNGDPLHCIAVTFVNCSNVDFDPGPSGDYQNAEFIAHAPDDIRALLAHIDALEAVVQQARNLLELFTGGMLHGVPGGYIEVDGDYRNCTFCLGRWHRDADERHDDECPVALTRRWFALQDDDTAG